MPAGRPTAHMHKVKIEEGADAAGHIRVVLPGGRHQQAHGADDVHPACQQLDSTCVSELESEPVSLTNGAADCKSGIAASGIYRYGRAPTGGYDDGVNLAVMRR